MKQKRILGSVSVYGRPDLAFTISVDSTRVLSYVGNRYVALLRVRLNSFMKKELSSL